MQVHAKLKALPQGSRIKSQNNLIACPKERKFHQNLIQIHKNKLKVPSPIYIVLQFLSHEENITSAKIHMIPTTQLFSTNMLQFPHQEM